jgi:hypothetical protein
MRADALVVLADVSGPGGDSAAALGEALGLYRAKGNDVAAAAVEGRIAG